MAGIPFSNASMAAVSYTHLDVYKRQGQVRECTAKLLRFAKTSGIAVLIIGHVTKDGRCV